MEFNTKRIKDLLYKSEIKRLAKSTELYINSTEGREAIEQSVAACKNKLTSRLPSEYRNKRINI